VPVPVGTPDMQLPGDLRSSRYSPQRLDLFSAGDLDVCDLVTGISQPPDPDEDDPALVIDHEVKWENHTSGAHREDRASQGCRLSLCFPNRHGGRVSPGHRASPRLSTAVSVQCIGDVKLRLFLVRMVREFFTVLDFFLKQVSRE